MSFQAYLDDVKAKTGKTPEDFAKLAAQKSLAKHRDSSSGIRLLSIAKKYFFAESKCLLLPGALKSHLPAQ